MKPIATLLSVRLVLVPVTVLPKVLSPINPAARGVTFPALGTLIADRRTLPVQIVVASPRLLTPPKKRLPQIPKALPVVLRLPTYIPRRQHRILQVRGPK